MMIPESTTRSAKSRKALTILGATGSVGKSTLDVVTAHPERYKVHALTAHRSEERLFELCIAHRPRIAVLSGVQDAPELRRKLREAGSTTELQFGTTALLHAVDDCDTVMAAIVGAAGLEPTLQAARAGKQILLANKEALVMAGPVFMRVVRDSAACLLPIDSEHNAVFQCLPSRFDGRADLSAVSRILLTASGGPFRTLQIKELAEVTPDQACAHPNWKMGRKISVDSATMMNKGLEVIEARWLFDVEPSKIQVLIHPQSIVHSMVEYVDGSVLAQLSNPDMRVPIAHALAFPERMRSGATPLDLAAIGHLQFEAPDLIRFPCLSLAYEALRIGGTAPAVLNAANEIAVEAFLTGRLRFPDISRVIADSLDHIGSGRLEGLESVLEADSRGRMTAMKLVQSAEGRAA